MHGGLHWIDGLVIATYTCAMLATTYRTRSKRLLHWFLVVFAGAVAYCGQHPIVRGRDPQMIQDVSFRGMRPSDEGGRNGLRNPARGLRIETLIAESPDKHTWGPAAHLRGKTTSGYSDDWWILDAQRYESHGLTLAQTYCYLDDYIAAAIPEVKLQWLQAAFDNLRKLGLKTVLRFAYERDMARKRGPNLPRHTVSVAAPLPSDLKPGRCKVGLWMPDASESLTMDPRYAIRVANAGVPWWTDTGGKYGINIIGSCEVVP